MNRLKYQYTAAEVIEHFESMISTSNTEDCPLCGLYYFSRHIEPCGDHRHCPDCPMCATCNGETKKSIEQQARYPKKSPEEQIKSLQDLLELFAVHTKECTLCGKYDAIDYMRECHSGSDKYYCEDCPGCVACEAAHTCDVCGWLGANGGPLRACHDGGKIEYCSECCCEECYEAKTRGTLSGGAHVD